MAKGLQPYASFTIEDNRVNFFNREIFPIDSMLTDIGQESAMLSKVFVTINKSRKCVRSINNRSGCYAKDNQHDFIQ